MGGPRTNQPPRGYAPALSPTVQPQLLHAADETTHSVNRSTSSQRVVNGCIFCFNIYYFTQACSPLCPPLSLFYSVLSTSLGPSLDTDAQEFVCP